MMNDSMRSGLQPESQAGSRVLGASVVGGVALVLAGLVVGCVDETSGGGTSSGGSAPYYGGGATSGTSGASGGASSTPAADGGLPPMVVDVDPGGTLAAAPGNGVGVFTQYQTGGHWLVWWTCDTNITGQSCAYTIAVQALQGNLSNIQGMGDGGTPPSMTLTSGGFSILSDTSTARNQVSFDAQAGASIELTVNLEPLPDQNFIFFVQNGHVNGGYQGNLTDPLILEPGSP
jgi:hypothetical protein